MICLPNKLLYATGNRTHDTRLCLCDEHNLRFKRKYLLNGIFSWVKIRIPKHIPIHTWMAAYHTKLNKRCTNLTQFFKIIF